MARDERFLRGAYAAAHLLGRDVEKALAHLQGASDHVDASGRRAGLSTILLMLAGVQLLSGHADDARSTLLRARRTPGPYQALAVDLIDRRLQQLERA